MTGWLLLAGLTGCARQVWAPGHVELRDGQRVEGLLADRRLGAFGDRLYRSVRVRRPPLARRYPPERVVRYCIGARCHVSLPLVVEHAWLQQRYTLAPGAARPRFVHLALDGPVRLYRLERVDPDSGAIDAVPLLRRGEASTLVAAPPGLFGQRRRTLSRFFEGCAPVVDAIEARRVRSAFDAVELANARCGEAPR